MASRHFVSASRCCAATACGNWVQFHDGLQQLLGCVTTRYLSSSVAPVEEKKGNASEDKWFELPPVPRPVPLPVRTTSGQNHLNTDGSHEENVKYEVDVQMQQLTALRWVSKCCPSVPASLIQKLFRLRQIRQRAGEKMECAQSPSKDVDDEKQRGRRKRVTGKSVLEEGAVLCVPKSVFQLDDAEYLKYQKRKAEHQPTPDEISWLQSFVIHKDSHILVINKPPGLPVQGGSDVRKSLDSLMGAALRYDCTEGPKLVHRLDKETSGSMVLARTQESATLLHTLFRNKTTTATSSSKTENLTSAIGRSYLALVIGTPKKSQGRISASLIKMVVDHGKSEKIKVADDESSENAQVAITDYKVVGPSNYGKWVKEYQAPVSVRGPFTEAELVYNQHLWSNLRYNFLGVLCPGCTWLELRPLTGRKHQLRVHCAEVLGTPVVGDLKYGWKGHRTWKEHLLLQNPETWSLAEDFIQEGLNNVEALGNLKKKARGSVLFKDLVLHLHCHELTLPDLAEFLEVGRSQREYRGWAQTLRFVSPLPPHMAVSKSVLRVV